MSVEQVTITVRYAQGTYVARAKGHKGTASCTHSTEIAAHALARKLGFDPAQHWASTSHHTSGSAYLFAKGEEQ
ncbi:MAG: hypothetical protein NDI93_01460 [Pseudomonas sp.]|nr:hypothetical protein [Pseudomonas sp.]